MPNGTEFVRRKLPGIWPPKPPEPQPAERLRTILRYEPETGEWFWLVDRAALNYVHTHTGDPAGYLHVSSGYIHIKIDGVAYPAHRLAFLYMMERWPEEDMDHINRIKDDNRWCNLREATRSQNSMNRAQIMKKSKWPRGVLPWGRQWRAAYSNIYLGLFKTAEEASAVREALAQEEFGEFYCEP
jgi:Demerecviridae HNH endonuclease